MSGEEEKGAYLYQGNTLVVPLDTPDSRIQDEVSEKLINAAFGGVLSDPDTFVVPAVDGSKSIRGISIPQGALPPGWKAIPMRQAVNIITGGTMADGAGPAGRLLRSHHIALWRGESRFCGSCGGGNRDTDNGELARQCAVCERLEFPRISPAVITIIINDRQEALLAHNKKFVNGIYSLIAGFNEPGENLEATVAREVKEEVNIDVRDIRYICSQPWPFPNSLMLGFSARYDGGEIKPDGIEIEDAQWFPRDRLPEIPGHGSVSRYLIELWLNGKL
ncbi:MAG: NAD(+) diphosphatase [Treponema sp.]|nr:NAD(+) diphosphatase [Treponema sp.]